MYVLDYTDDELVIGIKGVIELTGLSRSTIERDRAKGRLPLKPVGKLDSSDVFLRKDVEQWVRKDPDVLTAKVDLDPSYVFTGINMGPLRGKTLLQVITSHFDVTENECFEWKGYKNELGYGQIRINGKLWRVHRLVAVLVNGESVDNLVVRHSCDNPGCINPNHLSTGTRLDNVRDMDMRDRTVNGSKCSWARFTDEQVKYIKESSAAGVKNIELANEFGVHPNTIYSILAGKTYKS